MNGQFLQSKKFTKILILIGCFIIGLLIFRVGMAFGFRQALYSVRWGENYERNFVGRERMMPPGFGQKDLLNAHGATGVVLRTDQFGITMKGSDGVEKYIVVSTSTEMRRYMDTIKLSDIKIGETAIVVGYSNDAGQIEASILRLMP